MKITEITEGWGEYSNKSNHRMNKFKSEDTDEGWGEFKSAVQRGTDAVVGAAGRQLGDIKNTAMAKMGSGKAAGAQQMQRVVGGVIKNFNTYLGQIKSKPTPAALQQYLTALGFQNPILSEASPAKGDKAQGPDGQTYTWQGAQWTNDKTGRVAKKDIGASNTQSASTVLTRNQLFDIIGKNIQQAMKAGTLPKELKKFLGQ